jgi:exodeoxyribonuclease VII large subunit
MSPNFNTARYDSINFVDKTPRVPGVGELTALIKDLMEASFQNVDVEGEVSRPKFSANGHVYFTLKDARAQLPCVMWSSSVQRLNFRPEHGQQLQLSGDIQVYAPHGKYQLIVKQARQAGLGALQQAFERLKKKLEQEGLFNPATKKILPAYPRKIGIVSSLQAAALQDIIDTFRKRYRLAELLVHHAAVQGVQAAPQICRALQHLGQREELDAIILTRGGGSLEDLWAFNEESVARAIYACPLPVVSAVGHETDFCISDFVADVRAATPTQAVALMVPDINDLKFQVEGFEQQLRYTMNNRMSQLRQRVDALGKTHALHAVLQQVREQGVHLRNLQKKAHSALEIRLLKERQRHQQLENRLQTCNPDTALEQGYTRIRQGGKWIKQAADFDATQAVEIQWKDGRKKLN